MSGQHPRLWSPKVARVLSIPHGTGKKDPEGRGVGDDWILATLGCDENGTEHYVTTDCVHASELGQIQDHLGLGPRELADQIVEMVNARWRAAMEKA